MASGKHEVNPIDKGRRTRSASTPRSTSTPRRGSTVGIQKRSFRRSTTRQASTAGTETSEPTEARKREGAKSFRFLDLPGEIRNRIYEYMCVEETQLVLVHRPRIASLRPRTRLDRSRTLPSDITAQEYDERLSSDSSITNGPETEIIPRETSRPFWGLTQASRQLRWEFRPLYFINQEIGVDLTNIPGYVNAFYASATRELATIGPSGERDSTLSFVGNITVAVRDTAIKEERGPRGIEVLPLLEILMNGFSLQVGFGRFVTSRYSTGGYQWQSDVEIKDLYRLLGHQIRRDYSYTETNERWEEILRCRSLASVRVHRVPMTIYVAAPGWVIPPKLLAISIPILPANGVYPPNVQIFRVPVVSRPYIHLIFRREKAEAWMTDFESVIPNNWLAQHGFDNMEHFEVKVGVEE
ncbi:hypothetical protein COCMIDRAFT_26898 [Bipolaris oryzae ATCC 44560]|uniref:F-box domain-containing protein n=1 Tax=Bipolaris oryzae ATCC 44560 TaxID=930090 RepID=W6ZBK9_COCMI|nr:uncharacterized protein COCMIDRAFT_26898 [Bipolaris oryzae ATCC 44560]EUC44839.1 hypothetical protein COCMIDRAFT_26898 [Bipolaris oryzae ATCC 44560]